ncbi:MAG: hypothetical protein D6756_13460 [Cyanobacteria bacterium J083]|nr:MAG: hypothetical protein D6756_13460 [Cyanobacteria bacterium J083]
MITVEGKIEKKGFGFGTWALVTREGKTYELQDAPPELCQIGIWATVTGEILSNVMTTAMIGEVLAVKSYQLQG